MASVYIALIILLPMFKFIGCALMCKDDQLMRNDKSGNYICCYTVICQKGQKYAFCNHDQGHDTCANCPEGMYHLDTINTAIMNAILDPCIPKPTCDQPEVTLKNGECVCDRSRGYYGNDVNNCLLAEGMCSSPGFELKDNGRCEPCAEEYFKPEANSENLCKLKSRCFESQEIDSNGSTTEDRSCRARTGNTKNSQIVTTDNRIDSDNSFVFCPHLEPILNRISELERQVKRLSRGSKRRRTMQNDVMAIMNLTMIKEALNGSKPANRLSKRKQKKKTHKKRNNQRKKRRKRKNRKDRKVNHKN